MAAPRSTKAKASRARSSAVPRAARRRVTVSDYTGQTAAAAADDLRVAELRPAPERLEVDDPSLHGVVLEHDPPAGAAATRGETVTLFVGAAEAREATPPDDVPAPPQFALPVDGDRDGDNPVAGSENELGFGREDAGATGGPSDFGNIEPTPVFQDPDGDLPSFAPELPRRHRRRKRVIAALVVVACALIRALPSPHAPAARSPQVASVPPPKRSAPARARPRRTRVYPKRRTGRSRRRRSAHSSRTAPLAAPPPSHVPRTQAPAQTAVPAAPRLPPDAYQEFF